MERIVRFLFAYIAGVSVAGPVAAFLALLALAVSDFGSPIEVEGTSAFINGLGTVFSALTIAVVISPFLMLWIAALAFVPAVLSLLSSKYIDESRQTHLLTATGAMTGGVASAFVVISDLDHLLYPGSWSFGPFSWMVILAFMIAGAAGGYTFSRVWESTR